VMAGSESVMAGSDTALIVGVLVFVSGVTVNGVLLVDKVMVGGVLLSLDVEGKREIVILVGRVMVRVGRVLSLDDVESANEIVSKVGVSVIVVVSSGVGIFSPTLDTLSGSSINTPDCPGVSGTLSRAERAKCLACWEGELEATVIFALLGRWPKFAGNWPSFPPPGQ
jgi:hypothetical protein